ncbi:MAG: integrase [Proteobacteria bacterium]|nr:integrase [Pseudomonadota bacterium]
MTAAALDPRVVAAIGDWHRATRGDRRGVVERLASELGVSIATAYRRIEQLALKKPRKRRADAGGGALSQPEAELIWALVRETTRQTGTGALPVMEAVNVLRANGRIQAARVDEATGEWLPLGESAIRRGLRAHGYSLDVMTAPAATVRLSSPHPNWAWQIDASVSRQFYLADEGARAMDKAVYYRGNPGNFSKIAERRIWRYIVTDHACGAFELFYVQGAESAANVIATLMFTMTPRADGTMHGVPRILMHDPGPGMKAAPVANFCTALGIRQMPHASGESNVTGQVENAHYLVERYFEGVLRLREPVTSIAEINAQARVWSRAFQATRQHSRTGMTRRDGWLRITPEQLVLAPPVEVLAQLANSTPKPCTVRDCMIRFEGGVYSVRELPGGIVNGQKVMVARNALDPDSVRVVGKDEHGQETHFITPKLAYKDFGFLASAAEIGTEFKGAPESPADARNKAIEQLAMDARTQADAAAARKAKRLAFGGAIDPMKHLRDAQVAPALPRAATPSTVTAPSVVAGYIEPPQVRAEIPLLNHVEAAMSLKPLVERAGSAWMPDMYLRTATRWPEGVPHDAIESWATELATPRGLYLVGGAA